MKLLTKHTDYAVRALVVLLKNKKRFVSAREIARLEKIPYAFLRRVLRVLIKNKLIEAKEGVTGGVKASAGVASIKISDVINIFQGPMQLSDCMFRRRICHKRSACPLRNEIRKIERSVNQQFSKLTINHLT